MTFFFFLQNYPAYKVGSSMRLVPKPHVLAHILRDSWLYCVSVSEDFFFLLGAGLSMLRLEKKHPNI